MRGAAVARGGVARLDVVGGRHLRAHAAERDDDEGRGWCCFESGLSVELVERLRAFPRMKATLDLLSRWRTHIKATRWHEDGEKNAFSLTATTGAGKTVMAAAVFEALFFGSDDYDFEPDPGAVVSAGKRRARM